MDLRRVLIHSLDILCSRVSCNNVASATPAPPRFIFYTDKCALEINYEKMTAVLSCTDADELERALDTVSRIVRATLDREAHITNRLDNKVTFSIG